MGYTGRHALCPPDASPTQADAPTPAPPPAAGEGLRGDIYDFRGACIDTKEKALAIVRAALEKKAEDLLLLDIRKITTIADYFVICSGNTSRQVKAIAEEIDYKLSGERVFPDHVEGFPECRWVLMDYGDVVVHVFEYETREYYDLEGLWGDARKVEV